MASGRRATSSERWTRNCTSSRPRRSVSACVFERAAPTLPPHRHPPHLLAAGSFKVLAISTVPSYNLAHLGGTLMSPPAATGTLSHALCQVPDHRSPRGPSYPWPALLLLMATAMLCGARSLYAIAQWGT